MTIDKKRLKVTLEFLEETLALSAADPELYRSFIASKAPDASSREEEIEAMGPDAVAGKGTTVFPCLEDGTPFAWDYQIRGMFKDACGLLWRVEGSESKKIKAYKKVIDGSVFIEERRIPFIIEGRHARQDDIGLCERPLRAATPQGERITLASSETLPAGTSLSFTVVLFDDKYRPALIEWLDYGRYHGFSRWRNSGKGVFSYTIEEA